MWHSKGKPRVQWEFFLSFLFHSEVMEFFSKRHYQARMEKNDIMIVGNNLNQLTLLFFLYGKPPSNRILGVHQRLKNHFLRDLVHRERLEALHFQIHHFIFLHFFYTTLNIYFCSFCVKILSMQIKITTITIKHNHTSMFSCCFFFKV